MKARVLAVVRRETYPVRASNSTVHEAFPQEEWTDLPSTPSAAPDLLLAAPVRSLAGAAFLGG